MIYNVHYDSCAMLISLFSNLSKQGEGFPSPCFCMISKCHNAISYLSEDLYPAPEASWHEPCWRDRTG